MPPCHRNWVAVVFLTALAAYVATACYGLFPGEPTDLLASAGGMGSPLPTLLYPIWEGMIAAARRLGAGARALNLIHALLGAVSAALVFHLAVLYRTAAESDRPRWRASFLAHLPALAATLLFAGSFPAWFVATRAHPFHVGGLIALTGLVGLMHYGRTGAPSRLLGAAAALGLACAESPSMWFVVPAIGAWALLLTVRHRHLVLPSMPDEQRGHLVLRYPLLALAVWASAAAAVWAVRAALFLHEPAAEWADVHGFGGAALEVVRAQWRAVRRLVPPLGWMLLALCVGLPAVLTMAAAAGERPRCRGPALASYALVTLILAAAAWDVPIAPWPAFAAAPLLVWPYVVFALTAAASLAALLRLLLRDLDRADLPGGRIELTPPRRRAAAMALATMAAVAFGSAAVRHGFQIGACRSEPFDEFAEGALAESYGRDVLVTASPLAPIVAVAARVRRPELHVLEVQHGNNPVHMRYVAEVFADVPRLRGLATAGLDAVLMEWFARDPSAARRAAVVDLPDLWRLAGKPPTVGQWVYLGHTGGERDDLDRRWEGFAAWTARVARVRAATMAMPPPFRHYGEWLIAHAERMMNDFGVELEEHGRVREALAVYRAVVAANSNQFSAAHNLARLARELAEPDAEALQEDLREWLRRRGPRVDPAALARLHGRVRSPSLDVVHGVRAAQAGLLEAALVEVGAAATKSDDPAVRLALAALLEGMGDRAAGRRELERLLENHSGDPDLLVGLALLALPDDDAAAERAIERLRQMPEADVGPRRVVLEALLAARRGDLTRAEEMLTRAQVEHADDIAVRLTAAWVAWRRGDREAVRRAAAALRTAGRPAPLAELLVALVALDEGRAREGRAKLEEIVSLHPSYAPAWEALLALDYAERRADLGREHTRRLLRLRPSHPRANHFWASFYAMEEKWAEAEAALRVALAGLPDDPAVLNDLAWAIVKQGRAAEALPLARRAAELEPESPETLDTLGLALLESGDPDAAEAVLLRAAGRAPDHPGIRAHLDQARARRRGGEPSSSPPASRTAPRP